MMLKMELPAHFSKLIMKCVTSTTFQILINGNPYPIFRPSCGIRQGDSLSPFLFLICAEGFSGMIRHEVSKGFRHGIWIARDAPELTHLFFSNDSLLFF